MKEYLLINIEHRRGRLNATDIFVCTFVDVETTDMYNCTVDSSYRNYRNNGWDRVVHGIAGNSLGLYTGLKRTNRSDREGIPVITADSRPQQIVALTREELVMIIEARQREIAEQARLADPRNRLFDFDSSK